MAKSAPARHFSTKCRVSVVLVGRARVPLGERGDADAEVAGGLEQLDELRRVGKAFRMGNPGRVRIAGRVAAQREHVADADAGVAADDVAQLRDRVVDRGEVGHRVQLGLLGDRAGHLDGTFARGPAGPVGYGDERRLELLDAANGAPELPLSLVGLRREELERERPARLEHVGDARRGPPGTVLPGTGSLLGSERRLRLSRSGRHVSKHNPVVKILCWDHNASSPPGRQSRAERAQYAGMAPPPWPGCRPGPTGGCRTGPGMPKAQAARPLPAARPPGLNRPPRPPSGFNRTTTRGVRL